jgi:hypothetical protein
VEIMHGLVTRLDRGWALSQKHVIGKFAESAPALREAPPAVREGPTTVVPAAAESLQQRAGLVNRTGGNGNAGTHNVATILAPARYQWE